MAAKANNVPVLLHESNAFPGKAVKMLAPKVNTVLISFEEARSRIPKARNIVFTGTPVKIEKKDYTKEQKTKILKNGELKENLPIVLVFGGSQGAQKINEAIIGNIEAGKNINYQIYWATGNKQYDIVNKQLKDKKIDIENISNCKIVPYIYNMEEAENIADVIVARSGAMTVTEIANLSKPSILIPLPNVSNDHQMYNAKVLENVGAAKIIKNDELNGEILNSEIEKLVLNKEKCEQMGRNAYKVSNENVEDKIYEEIRKLVK